MKTKLGGIITNPFYFKVVWIVTGLLTAIPLVKTYMESYIKILLIWGIIEFFYLLVKKRIEVKSWATILLFLFCVSFGVSTLINWREGLYVNISLLAYTGVFMFVLAYCDKNSSKETILQELRILFRIVVGVTFVYSCICFVMFLFSIHGEYRLTAKLTYPYGMWEGRLWGLYNANTGSMLNYISILFSLFLLSGRECKDKGSFRFLVGNICLQACCFALAQSRGAMLALGTFVFGYVLFLKKNVYSYPGKRGILYRVLVAFICLSLLQSADDVLLSGMQMVENIPYVITYLTEGREAMEKAMQEKEELKKREIDDSNMASESSGRTALWRIGLQSFAKDPLFGTSFHSIDNTLKKELTKEGYINSGRGGLHNIYFTVLVSVGLVGTLILLAFWGILAWKSLRYIGNPNLDPRGKHIMLLLFAWWVGDLVESRIVLSTSFLSILFWIIAGYVLYFLKKDTEEASSV